MVTLTIPSFFFFFFNDTATTEIYTLSYTLSLHDALPIYRARRGDVLPGGAAAGGGTRLGEPDRSEEHTSELQSHSETSYAVFCLKKTTWNGHPETVHTHIPTTNVGPGIGSYTRFLSGAIFEPIVPGTFFFFNDPATTEIYTLSYTLSLHDALPISEIYTLSYTLSLHDLFRIS